MVLIVRQSGGVVWPRGREPPKRSYSCPKCGRLLFRGRWQGVIETDCPRCKRIRTFTEDDLGEST